MSLEMGTVAVLAIAGYVVWDAVFGKPSARGWADDAMMGLGIAAAGGCACALLTAVLLAIGRSCSKTVISADGLFVQRAPWRRNFVRWSDIQSAQARNVNGWRYIYLKTAATWLDVGLSIEVDGFGDFAAEIARHTLQSNPLRLELAKHVT
jgi:hypothetical protein